jgi:hypothetical protein
VRRHTSLVFKIIVIVRELAFSVLRWESSAVRALECFFFSFCLVRLAGCFLFFINEIGTVLCPFVKKKKHLLNFNIYWW